jgi:hypothetical protein
MSFGYDHLVDFPDIPDIPASLRGRNGVRVHFSTDPSGSKIYDISVDGVSLRGRALSLAHITRYNVID